MDPLMLARWQFGITTVYHFLFVPLTISLVFVVAGFQTAWYRSGNEQYLRLTRFFGKLFLINFALGIVTGIVQEFQFGMNWSDYSRFVGDVFGAPLAIEGLLSFFLESTFLGLWIFGWDRLPKKVHLATIWVVAFATVLSAFFILAANSWMQNPVGYRFNEAAGRAELTDIMAVFLSPTALVTFVHVIPAAFMTGGAFVAGIAMWRLFRHPLQDAAAFRMATKVGAWMVVVSGLVLLATGDAQAKVMTAQQPMKMAAAEALYETSQPASFSVFTIGTLDGSAEVFSIRIPYLLSFMATGSFDGLVEGINNLQEEYEQVHGPGDWSPNIPLVYWAFRLMMGAGGLAALAAAWFLWSMRKGRLPGQRAVAVAILLPLLPLAANSLGWIFTETGRQPWVVHGLMTTTDGVSPGTTAFEVGLTLVGFTLVYGILAVIEVRLLLRQIRAGLPAADATEGVHEDGESTLALGY
ncbi:MAG TPA: cytochrome ubiquinol oxidase subunit I [Patescibacteria group bacterium]|nr:cytochrome ubiquinol oxidase subunit I [Patescibacteria group bacterium]